MIDMCAISQLYQNLEKLNLEFNSLNFLGK